MKQFKTVKATTWACIISAWIRSPFSSWLAAGAPGWARTKPFYSSAKVPFWRALWNWQRAIDGNPWIVGSADEICGFGPVVEDVYPDCGPLAGIHAALGATGTDLNLMLAVDLPFLQSSFLNYLASQGRETAGNGRGAKIWWKIAAPVCGLSAPLRGGRRTLTARRRKQDRSTIRRSRDQND